MSGFRVVTCDQRPTFTLQSPLVTSHITTFNTQHIYILPGDFI
jgi:hypothetical protein